MTRRATHSDEKPTSRDMSDGRSVSLPGTRHSASSGEGSSRACGGRAAGSCAESACEADAHAAEARSGGAHGSDFHAAGSRESDSRELPFEYVSPTSTGRLLKRESSREHPHVDSLKEKASEEKVVRGHIMSAADIFKFVGLIAFIVVMVVMCALAWPYISGLYEEGGIDRVLAEVQNAGPLGVVFLLIIEFLQVVVAFIPGEVVQIAAGMLYGPWLGALVVIVGCVLSSAFVFVVVHKLGAPFVQGMVPAQYLEKFRKFEASGKMNFVVFILFLIPGLPKDVFTYLVPLTDMRMRTFLLISNVGRIPGVVVSTYAASGIVEGDYLQSAIIFAVAAVIAVLGILGYGRITKFLEVRAGAPADTPVHEKLDPEDYETRTEILEIIEEEEAASPAPAPVRGGASRGASSRCSSPLPRASSSPYTPSSPRASSSRAASNNPRERACTSREHVRDARERIQSSRESMRDSCERVSDAISSSNNPRKRAHSLGSYSGNSRPRGK